MVFPQYAQVLLVPKTLISWRNVLSFTGSSTWKGFKVLQFSDKLLALLPRTTKSHRLPVSIECRKHLSLVYLARALAIQLSASVRGQFTH